MTNHKMVMVTFLRVAVAGYIVVMLFVKIRILSASKHLVWVGLMRYIKGPDFPTGGIILGRSGIRQAYETGRGSIIIRSKVKIEEMDNGKKRIIVYEIPYQVNKATMIEKIASLVREKVSSPRGLPMARTRSPTFSFSLSPRVTACRPVASILMTAIS